MISFEEAAAAADTDGWAEVMPRVYLSSQVHCIWEQDEGNSPKIDYSIAPYWVTSDDNQGPFPIRDADEYEEIMQNVVYTDLPFPYCGQGPRSEKPH